MADDTPLACRTLGPGVYESLPTEAARVAALRAASHEASTVRVHVPLTVGAFGGRLLLDVPRRVLRALGARAPEPGRRRSRHLFFDDELLVHEAERAGLHFVERRGAWVVLAAGSPAVTEQPSAFPRECARALAIMPLAERRRHEAPRAAVAAMRALGRQRAARGPVGRARLRRAIAWADRAWGTPNCYRRVLAEVALDDGAARTTLVFGLDVGRSGHVALEHLEEIAFDVAFQVPPE